MEPRTTSDLEELLAQPPRVSRLRGTHRWRWVPSEGTIATVLQPWRGNTDLSPLNPRPRSAIDLLEQLGLKKAANVMRHNAYIVAGSYAAAEVRNLRSELEDLDIYYLRIRNTLIITKCAQKMARKAAKVLGTGSVEVSCTDEAVTVTISSPGRRHPLVMNFMLKAEVKNYLEVLTDTDITSSQIGILKNGRVIATHLGEFAIRTCTCFPSDPTEETCCRLAKCYSAKHFTLLLPGCGNCLVPSGRISTVLGVDYHPRGARLPPHTAARIDQAELAGAWAAKVERLGRSHEKRQARGERRQERRLQRVRKLQTAAEKHR
jgi:hypothetical protein